MSAGTLALTNGSTTVTGSSTVFQTDLAVNDFIVCKIGGTTYTLGVSTIGSNTALTLTQPFTGPTTTGVAWYAVPNQTLVGITTELAANLTTVYRSVLVNDANWTQVFSQSGDITVTLKDGSTFTGPSWRSITTAIQDNTTAIQNKADKTALDAYAKKGANSDITSITGLTTPLSIQQGGTGSNTAAGSRTNLGLKTAAVMDVLGSVGNGSAIIESGLAGSGNYIKFADGTLICFFNRGSIDVTSSARTEGSTSFYWIAYSWVFPAAFADAAKVAVSVTTAAWGSTGGAGTSAVMTGSSISALTTTGVSARIYAPISFASLNPLTLIAIGTWK